MILKGMFTQPYKHLSDFSPDTTMRKVYLTPTVLFMDLLGAEGISLEIEKRATWCGYLQYHRF